MLEALLIRRRILLRLINENGEGVFEHVARLRALPGSLAVLLERLAEESSFVLGERVDGGGGDPVDLLLAVPVDVHAQDRHAEPIEEEARERREPGILDPAETHEKLERAIRRP